MRRSSGLRPWALAGPGDLPLGATGWPRNGSGLPFGNWRLLRPGSKQNAERRAGRRSPISKSTALPEPMQLPLPPPGRTRSPAALRPRPWAAPQGASRWIQSRTLPREGPLGKLSKTGCQHRGTLGHPAHSRQAAPTAHGHLQTPGAGKRRRHSRTFRHATAVNAADPFHGSRQSTARAGRGAVRGRIQPSAKGEERQPEGPQRGCAGRCARAGSDWEPVWAGPVVVTTGQRLSTQPPALTADGGRWPPPPHGLAPADRPP